MNAGWSREIHLFPGEKRYRGKIEEYKDTNERE